MRRMRDCKGANQRDESLGKVSVEKSTFSAKNVVGASLFRPAPLRNFVFSLHSGAAFYDGRVFNA
jgi:hypothetical protein